jgi:tetratricopeptide (TPR) repeat protein
MSSYLDGNDSDSDREETAGVSLSEDELAILTQSVKDLKAEGNAHFAKSEFEEALAIYSSAINIMKENRLEKDPLILLNRSATYLALKRYVPALNDANQGLQYIAHMSLSQSTSNFSPYISTATELDPANWKGHWRKGVSLMAMSKRLFRTKQALQAFQNCRACSTLPSNKVREVENELEKARMRMEQQEAEVSWS